MGCNDCKHINCTEREQVQLKRLFGEYPPHICHKYNKRVFHRVGATGNRNHSTYLYPCEECEKENSNERKQNSI